MMALADWDGILAADDATIVLTPSEVVRLRHDLQAAQQKIAGLLAQVARYEKRSARMQDAADRYKDEAEKALELARRFARADRIECERSA